MSCISSEQMSQIGLDNVQLLVAHKCHAAAQANVKCEIHCSFYLFY